MVPLQFLSTAVLLFASTLVAVRSAEASCSSSSSSSIYHLELIHVDANGGFTKDELIRRAERRSRIRAAALSDDDDWTAAAASTTGGDDDTYTGKASYSQGEYLMELGIGTPEKPFMAIFDTGSDVIWTKEVARCSLKASSSFANNTCPDDRYCNRCDGEVCVFNKTYGSTKMGVEGFMAKENLTLSSVAGPNKKVITFGCAEKCRDDKGDSDCHRLIPAFSDGIVGLSKSPKSLLCQLKVSRFSYCLSNRFEPKLRSPIWLGGDKLSLGGGAGAAVQTTPLVDPKSVWDYKYYVELEGISIGGDEPQVRIPNEAFNHRSKDGGKGKGLMLVDSGSSFSKLETAAYNVLKNLLAEELKSEPFLNKKDSLSFTCFKHASGQPQPDAVLHFTGAKMRLRWSSYMYTPEKEPEHSCLMIMDRGQSMSILGNFQQQNMHMLYDLDGQKLSFVPVDDCSKAVMNFKNNAHV